MIHRGLGILLLDDVISPDLPRSLSLLALNSRALMGPMELLDLRVDLGRARMLRRRRIRLPEFCWNRENGRNNKNWLVVSNIFYFHPCLGKFPILTNIFQMG